MFTVFWLFRGISESLICFLDFFVLRIEGIRFSIFSLSRSSHLVNSAESIKFYRVLTDLLIISYLVSVSTRLALIQLRISQIAPDSANFLNPDTNWLCTNGKGSILTEKKNTIIGEGGLLGQKEEGVGKAAFLKEKKNTIKRGDVSLSWIS